MYGASYARELAAFLDDATRDPWRLIQAMRRRGQADAALASELHLRQLLRLRRRAIVSARTCNLCERIGTEPIDPRTGTLDACDTYDRFRADQP